LLGSAPSFAPITTEDGDGLVAIPSALLMGAGSSTPRYWFDLAAYAKDGANALGHSEELAIPQLQDLVLNIVGNSSALPQYVSDLATRADTLGRAAALHLARWRSAQHLR